jgi:hypothetical protein
MTGATLYRMAVAFRRIALCLGLATAAVGGGFSLSVADAHGGARASHKHLCGAKRRQHHRCATSRRSRHLRAPHGGAATPDATTPEEHVAPGASAPLPGQGPNRGEAVIYGLVFAAPSEEGLAAPPHGPPVSVSDPAVVTLTNASTGARIEEQKVAAGSAGFRFVVPAGRYILSATDEASPTASCAPDMITVTEGQQANPSIGCTKPS